MNIDRILQQQHSSPNSSSNLVAAVGVPGQENRLGTSGSNLQYGNDAMAVISPRGGGKSSDKQRRSTSPRRRKQTEVSKRGKRLGGQKPQFNTIPMLFSLEASNETPCVTSPTKSTTKLDPPGVLSEDLRSSCVDADWKELGAFLSSKPKRRGDSKKSSKSYDRENTTVVNWMRCNDSVAGDPAVRKAVQRKQKKKKSPSLTDHHRAPRTSRQQSPSVEDFDQTSTTTSSSRRSEEILPDIRRSSKKRESRRRSTKSLSSTSTSSSSSAPSKKPTTPKKRTSIAEAAATLVQSRTAQKLTAHGDDPFGTTGMQDSFRIDDLVFDDTQFSSPSRSNVRHASPSRKSSNKSSSSDSNKKPSVAEAAAASARARGRPAYSDKSTLSNMQNSLRIEDLSFPSTDETAMTTSSSSFSRSSGRLSASTPSRLSHSGRRLSMVKGGSAQQHQPQPYTPVPKSSSSPRRKSKSVAPPVCAPPLDFSDFEDDDFSVSPPQKRSSAGPFAVKNSGAIEW